MKISIVIPAYNTPYDTIYKTIMSIINQELNDIEVLVIDDGSKLEYSQCYSKLEMLSSDLKVYKKNNGGVSSARNYGTSLALGDYIMYVDSDDILYKNTLKIAKDIVEKTNADLVIGGVEIIKSQCSDVEVQRNDDYCALSSEEINMLRRQYLGEHVEQFYNIQNRGYISRGPYSRLVKSNIAKRVAFIEDLAIGEDAIWNMQLLNECDSIVVHNELWYGYVIIPRANTAIRKYYGNRVEIAKKYLKILYDDNKQFMNENMSSYALAVMTEFYTIIRFEYMSPKNNMSNKEKKILVKEMIKSEPWSILWNRKYNNKLRFIEKSFINICKFNIWIPFVKIWNLIGDKND